MVVCNNPDLLEHTKSKKRYPQFLKSFLFIGLFWTVLILSLAAWAIQNAKENTTARTMTQASSFFQQIVLMRLWVSLHGGVYVPVTKETPPNPYLNISRRDVLTKDRQALTLINPAYMTRQIAEIASSKSQIQFHITSLKPIRPGNAPADWEAKALGIFSDKTDEYYTWWLTGENEKSAFRYMAPLWTERSCLTCHAKQGYAEGDLRGGISVTIPAKDILSELHHYNRVVGIRYFLIWIGGLTGIVFFFRLSRREYMERSRLIDNLETALKDVKTLKGFIPMCASCKKVRNDQGFWDQIESYIGDHSDAEFSHGMCPDCMNRLYPEYVDSKEPQK